MILNVKDFSNLKIVEELIDTKDDAERQILNAIKDYRYKEIGKKLLNKINHHFLKNDVIHSPTKYEYHSDWYQGKPYNTFMDFFTRKLTDDKTNSILKSIKDCKMITPNECNIEALGNLKETKKIIRLKKDSVNVVDELKKFDINILGYNYIDMKLLVTFYHRIHMPVKGKITKMIPIEGKEDFFGRNSLWILEIKTNKSPVYLLLVGESTIQDFDFLVEKNDELSLFDTIGFFNWGSQTLILYNPQDYNDINIKEHTNYFVGECIFNKNK